MSIADQYASIRKEFAKLITSLGVDLEGLASPNSVSCMRHISSHGLKYNTITSYLMALGHGFKSHFMPDFPQDYVVRKLVVGLIG